MDPRRNNLRRAYDLDAERRSTREPEPWRLEIVDALAHRICGTGEVRVIDLGCGTGQLASRLISHRLRVVAVDLSPSNVRRARERGVPAMVADFTALPCRDASFHGALAFNSFLHVGRAHRSHLYAEVRRVLVDGAVLAVVVWGGVESEGPLEDDWLDPPRFFSFMDDDHFAAAPTPGFDRLDTRLLHEHRTAEGLHPQVMLLRAS